MVLHFDHKILVDFQTNIHMNVSVKILSRLDDVTNVVESTSKSSLRDHIHI